MIKMILKDYAIVFSCRGARRKKLASNGVEGSIKMCEMITSLAVP
jgi:hypothetical protein